jgi:hypothetical protein
MGPRRSQTAAPTKKRPDVVDVLQQQGGGGAGKAPRKSRTEVWREQQQAEAEARQALRQRMLPPPPPPAQTALGWFRGEIIQFDQRSQFGAVRFPAGVAGITRPRSLRVLRGVAGR